MGEAGMKIDVFKFFTKMFCADPKKANLAGGWEEMLYDVPSQLFCLWKNANVIYWKFEFLKLFNKIIKENYATVEIWNIDKTLLSEFRRVFYGHPEFKKKLLLVVDDEENIVEGYNYFVSETVKLKIYDDIDVKSVSEFKYYFFAKEAGTLWRKDLWGIVNELFSFFECDRFDDVPEEEVMNLIEDVAWSIKDWTIPDPRNFKSLNDWDLFPDEFISRFEKLVLKNYNLKDDVLWNVIDNYNFNKVRDALGFSPRWWQRYLLVFQSRENHIANSRRSWKSYVLMYIGIRQLFLPGQMVLYIIPTKEWFSEQPFQYAEKLFENAKLKWIDTSSFRFNSKDFKVVNTERKSKLLFMSAIGSSGGRSFATNLCLIDESAYIADEKMYEVAYTSTTDKKWCTIASSTINIDMPINWFFYKKIELDGMYDWKCFSVDLYNNPFWTDKEKKRIENKYRYKKPLVRNCEYMAIFNTEWGWFQIDKFFTVDFDYSVKRVKWIDINIAANLSIYTRFIIGQDPAKTMDKCGMCVCWVMQWGGVKVISTWYIMIKDYILQTEFYIELKDRLKRETKKEVDIVVDLGKWGGVLRDYYKSREVYVYGILSTWWANANKKSYRELNVPKENLSKLLVATIASWQISGYSWLENIRNEFETYDLANERKLGKWEHHHNDVLSALMMCAWVLYERRILSFADGENKTKERMAKVMEALDPQFAKQPEQRNKIGMKWSWRFLY